MLSRRPRSRWRDATPAFALVALGAAPGCETQRSEGARCPANHRITSGEPDARYLGLSEAQRAAVVSVQLQAEGGTPAQRCSGVVVGEGVVLTARHCAGSAGDVRGEIRFGPDANAPSLTTPVLDHDRHGGRDLMLLYFDETRTAGLDFHRLPVASRPLSSPLPVVVQLAGYGLTETLTAGERQFVAEALTKEDAAEMTVDGGGVSGACIGDSGGPLLRRDEAGQVRVYGVLSRGASSCRGQDVYARVDTLDDWHAMDAILGDETAELSEACGELPGHGRCFGHVAASCRDGELVLAQCDALESCGWHEGRGHFGCVSPADDPCRGISDIGQCDGERARWCAGGRLVSAPCDVCADSCGVSPTSGRVACFGPAASE